MIMPRAGLSLLGFMDQNNALNYLRSWCVPVDDSDVALIAEWHVARAARGNPTPNAGNPDMQPLSTAHPYVQQLMQSKWAPVFARWEGMSFQIVEIDPLLAYQIAVETARLEHLCAGLTQLPAIDELLPICLPLASQSEEIQVSQTPQSIMVRAKSLNVHTTLTGLINSSFLGIEFGPALPFVHVARYNNRCYLTNGFHRAVSIRSAGATHMPCVFRDLQFVDDIGFRDDGRTFTPSLLESEDPPTLAHFARGRAHAVSLRSLIRVLHVSWAQYAVPEE
jgi:hypothetical protein